MFKRSLAAACASVVVLIGVAPAASAAPRAGNHTVVKAIDWKAPQPSAPSRAIDWH